MRAAYSFDYSTEYADAQFNVYENEPAIRIGLQAISFAAAGIDSTNIKIIFLVGNPTKSFVPGRSINAITGFEIDKGYYIVPKVNMDLSEIAGPPF
jgi:hypothetical protein